MFEPYSEKLLERRAFLKRMLKYTAFYLLIIGSSLMMGIVGYVLTEKMSLTDAFLNSAMLMGGMGQINSLQTDAGKLFAGAYALYCGLAEIVALAIVFSPIVHRFLHSLNIESSKRAKTRAEQKAEEKEREKEL